MNPNPLLDLVIVGCGPAGMMAAIYAKRANKEMTVLDKSDPGGRVLSTYRVDNYLGFSRVSAEELVRKMVDHLHDLEILDTYGEVLSIERVGSAYRVHTDVDTYDSKAIIIAAGTHPKPLGLANESEYLSQGLSYCAVCDGIFFQGKNVAVVGGGDSALEESLYLAEISNHVTIIHDLDQLTASAGLIKRVNSHDTITVMPHTRVTQLNGLKKLASIDVIDLKTQQSNTIAVDGLFVYVGNQPKTDFVKGLGILDSDGFIKVDHEMKTKMPGIFACGDVTKKDYRLIATAISDGAIAALSAVKYLDHLE